MSQLTTNTTTIDELITMANNLPDAGSGGSGGVETCTVTLTTTSNSHPTIVYTGLQSDGTIMTKASEFEDNVVDDVIKGSFIFMSRTVTNLDGNAMPFWTDFLWMIKGNTEFNYNPCFVTGTRITLADGTTKPVEEITYNDELLVWDFDNGCYSAAKPIWIKVQQTADFYYRCTFEDGTILKLVGSNGKCHRVFDLELNRFESATDCAGKIVSTIDGEKKLISCERIDEEVKFYNIITEYHFNLFAENVLTSCRLNNLYPIENMKYMKEDRELIPFEAYPDATLGLYKGLRLGERKSEDVSMINEYVNRLIALSASKEV